MKKRTSYQFIIVFTVLAQVLLGCGKNKDVEVQPISPEFKAPSVSGFTPKSAKVGETVTLTGELFGVNANVVAVKFGDGTEAKAKTVSPNQITVDVPVGAKTGQLSVMINGGTFKTSDVFTFIP